MPFWTRSEPRDTEDDRNMNGLRIRDARRYDSEGIGVLWRELMLSIVPWTLDSTMRPTRNIVTSAMRRR
ncbi:MAG: hypothetical protein JWN14_1144 [Chthonomonadales bacterium]|nr:hypothetical protein [Chthonomonadales bacterium]